MLKNMLSAHRKLVAAAIFLCITVGIVVGLILLRASPAIPPEIKKQLNFVILYPENNNPVIVNRNTFKYDSQTKVLSFMSVCYGAQGTITEQVTPDSFVDIPGYYDKVLEQMNSYSSFDTVIGTAYLTHPSSLNGDQVVVMNTKGTLMFVHSTKEVSQDNWRQFFNSLEIIK